MDSYLNVVDIKYRLVVIILKLHWKERYGKGGVCDFKQNYDFYFKWLLNKTAACFYITGLPDTINETYLKTNLLLDGNIAITDFGGKLYACIGSQGGPPDEYYKGTVYTIANPVLGSKMAKIGTDCIVVYNNELDQFTGDCWISGLYELINQTATLLADNIVSISCCQINTRVQAMAVAESEGQALGAEIALKKMYAGQPYQVLRSDLIDKLTVNPINNTASGQNIAELVELYNYIIANYFQSIGVRSNNIRKKSHVLQDEIDVQNDYLQISIFEILTSWQSGFDKVNELYGTDIHVELNPALLDTIIESETDDNTESTESVESTEPEVDNTTDDTDESDIGTESESESDNIDSDNTDDESDTIETVVDKTETVEQLVDLINDKEEVDDNGSMERSSESEDVGDDNQN